MAAAAALGSAARRPAAWGQGPVAGARCRTASRAVACRRNPWPWPLVSDPWSGSLEHARRRHRPPAELHASDDVFLRHHAPVATVGAVVAMIAHHEVVAVGNHLRTPVVVAAILSGYVIVIQRNVVHIHAAVDDAHGVPVLGDDALHERFLRIERVVEHHYIAAPRLADAIGEFIDDQPILILERRRHAEPLDAGDLESERDD